MRLPFCPFNRNSPAQRYAFNEYTLPDADCNGGSVFKPLQSASKQTECLCRSDVRVEPALNVRHHNFFVNVIEQIMKVALVEL